MSEPFCKRHDYYGLVSCPFCDRDALRADLEQCKDRLRVCEEQNEALGGANVLAVELERVTAERETLRIDRDDADKVRLREQVRADELRTQLAAVTAERDELRREWMRSHDELALRDDERALLDRQLAAARAEVEHWSNRASTMDIDAGRRHVENLALRALLVECKEALENAPADEFDPAPWDNYADLIARINQAVGS